jgi:gas vesicle protein
MFDNLINKSKKNNSNKIFFFSFISAVLGGIGAILFTPVKGKEARKAVSKKSKQASLWAKDKLEDLKEEFEDEAKISKEKIQKVVKKARVTANKAKSKTTKTIKKISKKPISKAKTVTKK